MSYPPPPPGGHDPYQPLAPQHMPQPPSGQDPYQPLAPQYMPPPPMPGQVPGGGGTNGLAIGSMVSGIVSLLLFCCTLLSGPAGIAAVVLGLVSLNQINQRRQEGKGMAIAGIATGGAALLVQAAWFIFNGFAMLSGTDLWSD
jgi:Domain of unknown function (DUF4190)